MLLNQQHLAITSQAKHSAFHKIQNFATQSSNEQTTTYACQSTAISLRQIVAINPERIQ